MHHLRHIIVSFFVGIIFTGAIEEDCIDFQGNTIPHGLPYIPGPSVCDKCICYHSESLWCITIYCDPPYFCRNFRFNGNKCCDYVCLDDPLPTALISDIENCADSLTGLQSPAFACILTGFMILFGQ